MLWRRHEAKNIPLQLSGGKKESLLRGLAFMMMQQRVRDLPRTNILHELSSALRRISTSITAEDILSDVTSNGLLLERENDVYAFAHLTFQEYLASAYIRDKGYVETLVTSVDDIWWRETTLLYASKCDADPIVRACLRSGSTTSLMLAFDCADQGSELAPELRDGLDRILDSTKVLPEHVRARARFLVTRHLRRVLHTAGGSRVCASPISNAIYDLFIIDHPRHWVWSSRPSGNVP
jgi:predicted NACHT family NTPase